MQRTLLVFALTAAPALAADAPYAGQQDREISSFSADDILAIQAGEGWGLAKPAELNGWPGPRHVLDLRSKLALTETQVAEVRGIFENMNAEAKASGKRYLDAEAAIDSAFASGRIDEALLAVLVGEAEAARAHLREVHLNAHLATAPLLTDHQKMLYARLRGYAGDSMSDHSVHRGHN